MTGLLLTHNPTVPGASAIRKGVPRFRRPLPALRSAVVRRRAAPGLQRVQATAATGAEVVTDKTYQDLVLSCPVPCVLIFWEEGNNKSDQYAAEAIQTIAGLGYGEKLRTLLVNIEQSPVIAEDCCVLDVPTMMIFKGGVEQEALRGKVPQQELAAAIKKYMP